MESSVSNSEVQITRQAEPSDIEGCNLSPPQRLNNKKDQLQFTQVSSYCDAGDTNCRSKENSHHENSSNEIDNVSSSAGVATPPMQSDNEESECTQLLANLELSESTMMALQEFLREEQERKEKLNLIQQGNIPEEFEENWNLSQFWYSQVTADCLAEECLRLTAGAGSIACIASPTLYRSLRSMQHQAKVNVLEFDSRFAVYGEDFVLYDYRSPLSVPVHLRDSFDVVVADPPYLEEDCLTKVALTIKMVSKPDAKIILCTGRVMEDLAAKLMGLKLQNFEIRHEKERLSNPFGCFANYDLDEYCKYKN